MPVIYAYLLVHMKGSHSVPIPLPLLPPCCQLFSPSFFLGWEFQVQTRMQTHTATPSSLWEESPVGSGVGSRQLKLAWRARLLILPLLPLQLRFQLREMRQKPVNFFKTYSSEGAGWGSLRRADCYRAVLPWVETRSEIEGNVFSCLYS